MPLGFAWRQCFFIFLLCAIFYVNEIDDNIIANLYLKYLMSEAPNSRAADWY